MKKFSGIDIDHNKEQIQNKASNHIEENHYSK